MNHYVRQNPVGHLDWPDGILVLGAVQIIYEFLKHLKGVLESHLGTLNSGTF